MDYASYLQLDRLLAAQSLESEKAGRPAHDEMLFIIVHQTHELWFKQVLYELDGVQERLAGPELEDREVSAVARSLERVLAVFRTLVAQLDVLETMTPLDFLEFRDLLTPASGFQSEQFRLVEARLGLPRAARLAYNGRDYDQRLGEDARASVRSAEDGPTLFGQIERWLERTPFMAMGDYDFRTAYQEALEAGLASEAEIIHAQPDMAEDQRAAQLEGLDRSRALFDALLDPDRHAELVAEGEWRMAQPALQAALFIMLYRDEPALQQPFRLLSLLMDVDETMSFWRHRHALMAQRMIGRRVGTGGSSGHAYLAGAAARHRVFGDLFALVTFLLPRSARPKLPDPVRAAMAYRYAEGGAEAG